MDDGIEESGKRIKAGDFVFYFLAVLFVTICGVTAVKYHYDFNTPNTPDGVLENVARIPNEWAYMFSTWQESYKFSKIPVLVEFDRKASNQTIQAGVNALPISKSDLSALSGSSIKPVETGKFPDLAILLPVRLSNKEKAIVGTDWVKNVANPIVPASKDPIAYGKTFIVGAKGTEIIVPVEDAKLTVATNGTEYNVINYTIIFFGPDGTEYNLLLSTPQDIRLLSATNIIKNAINSNTTSNLSLAVGTAIATTSSDRVKIVADMFAYPPGYTHSKLGIPCNFSFVEKPNNGKIAIAFLK